MICLFFIFTGQQIGDWDKFESSANARAAADSVVKFEEPQHENA
jgi:hypothetical protein